MSNIESKNSKNLEQTQGLDSNEMLRLSAQHDVEKSAIEKNKT